MRPDKKINIKQLSSLGVMTGIEVVLTRFLSINAWNIRIGFGFIPIVLVAMLYGPVQAGIVAALADMVGVFLFPTGPFFPGFTATAFLTGAVYGLFLHKKQTALRIGGAVLINQFVISLLINSLWISILYGAPYLPLLATRVIQCLILAPVQFIVIGFLSKVIKPQLEKSMVA